MKTVISILIALALSNWGICGWAAEQPPPTPAQEQPEVLTSGPVNEAFAEPVNLENQTGIVAPSQPPPNIEEVPPANRPVGDEFVWVPGYWGWDPSRKGYVWISGCWRAAPPKMYWVPGYWAAVGGGWQWVAGFWSPVADNEIEYLPQPPPLADVEAPGPPPAANRIWVPPCWYWDGGQYIRRPGYWVAAHADWVWVPSHYLWTPRGYVFVTGYWDYSLRRRGVLFAPVYFPRHFYGRPGLSYSLSIVVDIGNLEFGLFTYPRYSHYYFGDYYGDTFISIGLYPWFECVSRHTWYDPIYFHDRWRHSRTERRWEDQQRHDYERRLADRSLRPARTYREMERRIGRLPESQRRGFRFAEPMTTVITRKTTTMRFEPLKSSMRTQLTKQSAEVRTFREERSKWELQGPGARRGRPSIERVPSSERRGPEAVPMERRGSQMEQRERQARPPTQTPVERRRPEVQQQEQRQGGPSAQTPSERRRPEIQPQERHRGPSVQTPVERRRPEAQPQEQRQGGRSALPEQSREPSVSRPGGPQKNPERIKIPTPPVSGKRGGTPAFRRAPPAHPFEERRIENKERRKEQEKQKRGEQEEGERKRR